jgi:uncharacterized protein (DUF58 family)
MSNHKSQTKTSSAEGPPAPTGVGIWDLGFGLSARGPRTSWQLTLPGLLWLLVAGLIVGLGIGKNINLLALLGTILLVIPLLNAFVAGRRLRGLRVQRRFDDLLFAGAPGRVELNLRNGTSRACQGVRLEDGTLGHLLAWYLDRVEGQSRRTCHGEVRLPGRGAHAWGPLVLSSGHPFGLVRRRVVVSGPVGVLVLPRPGRLNPEHLRRQLRGIDPHGERVRRRGWRHEAAQADFHGLRPFRPGDSPRWIHWRTSARRGELMVREFEDVPGDDLVLVLAPGLQLDAVVDAAATVVWEWCRRRGDRLVLVAGAARHEGLTGPEHARALLERLATLGPADLAGPLAALDDLPATLCVAVLCAGGSELARQLEAELGRPVALLDVARASEWGYDPQ